MILAAQLLFFTGIVIALVICAYFLALAFVGLV